MALSRVINYTFSSQKPVYARAVPSVSLGTVAEDPQSLLCPYVWWAVSAWLCFCGRTSATWVEMLTSRVAPVHYCTQSMSSIIYRTLFLPPWRLTGRIYNPPFRTERSFFPQALLIAKGLERHAIRVVTFWSWICLTRIIWDGFYPYCSLFCETMLLSKPALFWPLHN